MGSTTKQQIEPLLWTARQVATCCGWSLRSVWRGKAVGLLPKSIRLGGSIRWRAEDIKHWVQADCPKQKEFEARKGTERAK